MNERIRELSEQAYHSTADELAHLQRVHNRTYDLNETAAIYNEKFAELIVRECANMAESFHRHQYDFTGNLELHEFIKTHFGVEE